ncbi:MAG: aminoglycoside phosphotransferase [Clostridia bacterium]|jgi:hygromycin-B 4-O-kinase|nr:aminoglycoside phosphotransferase [Clostridia bacterium]
MKSFKVDINTNQAEEILKGTFGESVTDLSPIEMGELSKVFSFMVKDKPYVVHFRKSRESLDKADYMYKFYGDKLPIPPVVMSGESNEVFFNISNKAEGRPVSSYSVPEQKIILDDLAKHYTNMSQIILDPSKGFGLISPEGTACSKSWGEVIAGFFKEDQEGFYKDWTKLYKESFLEKSLFEEGYLAMMELIKYSPNIPHLVHGDFHLGNILSDGKQVTGIVDWELSMYGDFMFDLAILHLWSPHLDFPQKVRNLWLENGTDIVNFEERLRSHMLFKAVDGLRFYAKQGAKPSYDFIRKIVVNLLKGL